MNEKQRLKVEVTEGRLVISIGVEVLGFAATRGPWFDELYGDTGQEPVVTDAEQFAKAICTELKREKEDGETLVHAMLDKAAERAAENGCEGIRLPGDPERG